MDMGKEEKSSNQPTRLASQRIGGWKDLKKFVCVRKTWSWKEESSLEDPAAWWTSRCIYHWLKRSIITTWVPRHRRWVDTVQSCWWEATSLRNTLLWKGANLTLPETIEACWPNEVSNKQPKFTNHVKEIKNLYRRNKKQLRCIKNSERQGKAWSMKEREKMESRESVYSVEEHTS